MPSQSSNNNNRSCDINGSRTTNTSANVSPSLNDNNSRTVLLGSDDIRTPRHHHHQLPSSRHRQRSTQVHTDSTADYDDVASHSTVDDTTPQTSSENASISEVPFDSRFKTFVKQKKSKLANPSGVLNATSHAPGLTDCYDRRLPPAPSSEDTDNEPTANLLEEHYADALPVRSSLNGGNHISGVGGSGSNQKETHFAGKDSNHRISAGRMSNHSSVNYQNGAGAATTTNNDDESGDADDRDNDGDDQEHDEERVMKKLQAQQDEDESDDSPDEDEEDVEEGVYDLGTSNLFMD